MAEYLHPGVYVEEIPTRLHSIEGVSTSTAAFIGSGPRELDPVLLTSFAEFDRTVGSSVPGFLPLAVRGFFENGGHRCYVALSARRDPIGAALEMLARATFSLLCCPDEHQFAGATARIVACCERRKDFIGLLQLEPPLADLSVPKTSGSSYAAWYYPWLVVPGIGGQSNVTVPPVGHLAGLYARTDIERGVHKAPEGIPIAGALNLSHDLSAAEVDSLASHGINPLRAVPDRGIVPWGARTASEDADYQYVNVRRLLIFLEQSIVRGLQWAVFEPNDAVLWISVAGAIHRFLLDRWREGALVGSTAESAFFVRCDRTTMTQADLDAGRFVAIVGVAPLRPAEFVQLRITGQTKASDDE